MPQRRPEWSSQGARGCRQYRTGRRSNLQASVAWRKATRQLGVQATWTRVMGDRSKVLGIGFPHDPRPLSVRDVRRAIPRDSAIAAAQFEICGDLLPDLPQLAALAGQA